MTGHMKPGLWELVTDIGSPESYLVRDGVLLHRVGILCLRGAHDSYVLAGREYPTIEALFEAAEAAYERRSA